MKPIAAAVAGALVAGTAMYTVGARTTSVEAFTTPASMTAPNVPGATAPQPAVSSFSAPAVQTISARRPQRPAPRRTAARDGDWQRIGNRPVYNDDARDEPGTRDERSWSKSATIIGGSAASGAGVGAIVDGKKGAVIGAAIGGGAASIYEATRRR